MTTPSKAEVLAPGVGRTISAKLGVKSRTALGVLSVKPAAFHDRPGVLMNTSIGRASRLMILQDGEDKDGQELYSVVAFRGKEVLGSHHLVKNLHATITALTGVPLEP